MPDNRPPQSDPGRILLGRMLAGRGPSGMPRRAAAENPAGRGTPRFTGRVFDKGAMPRGQEAVYMVHPLDLDGDEAEGGTADPRVDETREIPVVVIGPRQVAVGDTLIVQSLGGRWVAHTGIDLPNCNPIVAGCAGNRYAAAGTVTDAINGVSPIVYDFAKGAWYSAWLPFSGPDTLQSGAGQDPCYKGDGTSYYFYMLTAGSLSSTGRMVANLYLPGQSCRDIRGVPTVAYFGYAGPAYPRLLGDPAGSIIAGFTLPSVGVPGGCDPMTYAATWSGATVPVTAATFSVPKYTPPGYGFTCSTPCPLPRKDLTVSWVNAGGGGNGSGTLAYDVVAKDWRMACAGGLTVRLSASEGSTLVFTVTTWDGPDCSGASHPFSNPASIGLASSTCQPIYLAFNVLYNTSVLYLAGYRSFTVTE